MSPFGSVQKLNESESIWQNPSLQYKLHYEEKIQFSIRIL
jgi:hypothetical protein